MEWHLKALYDEIMKVKANALLIGHWVGRKPTWLLSAADSSALENIWIPCRFISI